MFKKILRNVLMVSGGAIAVLILLAILAPKANKKGYEPIDPERTDINPSKPYMEVAGIEEAHIGNIKRYSYNVVIFQKLNKADLEGMAKLIYEQAKTKTPFNALMVYFYDYPQFIGRGTRFGSVNFAPNGKWEDATTIKTGDYSKMKMTNHLIEPKWENSIIGNEAEIISYFFTVCQELEMNATTGEEFDAAEEFAIQEAALKYNITEDAVDSLLMKYNLGY